MKCFACDGTGVECCSYCDGEGECAHCGGGGNGPCLLCEGVGEEPHPDSFSKERWAKAPEPIRKIVEQHVAAHLPADILAKLHDLHARGLPISHDGAFFHFSVTTNWRPAAACAPIGTTAGFSPRSPQSGNSCERVAPRHCDLPGRRDRNVTLREEGGPSRHVAQPP